MRPILSAAIAAVFLAGGGVAAAQTKTLGTAEVKQRIIRDSIASYPGNCPCPYNSASNGSRCGRRSAYSRSGGYSTICYAEDVTPEMVAEWRERH